MSKYISFAITKNGKPVFDKHGNIEKISYKESDNHSLMEKMYNNNKKISKNGRNNK